MIHTIENNFLTVQIQHKGAEICSLKSKKSNQEFMWNADPDIWGSYAPVLFPIIGMLKNGTYSYNNKIYSIPKHGFIRNNDNLEVAEKSDDSITLSYKYNEDSLAMYPFKFVFLITFKLVENSLQVIHTVDNVDEKEILFSIGGHPGFKCPLKDNESYTDYYIEFEEVENENTWTLAPSGLLSGDSIPSLNNTKMLPLHETLFINDALIYKTLKSSRASLKNKNSNTTLTVSFDDFDYLGIWAKPGAPFVCIEPWLGITDADNTNGELSTKEGIIKLDANNSYQASFSISINE